MKTQRGEGMLLFRLYFDIRHNLDREFSAVRGGDALRSRKLRGTHFTKRLSGLRCHWMQTESINYFKISKDPYRESKPEPTALRRSASTNCVNPPPKLSIYNVNKIIVDWICKWTRLLLIKNVTRILNLVCECTPTDRRSVGWPMTSWKNQYRKDNIRSGMVKSDAKINYKSEYTFFFK